MGFGLPRFQKNDSVGGNTFFTSDESEALRGCCLHTNLIGVNHQDSGDIMGHRLNVWVKFWLLRHDSRIRVDYFVSPLFDNFSYFPQQHQTGDTFPFTICIGKVISEVSRCTRTTQPPWMFVRAPTRMRLTSPRMTTFIGILRSSPISTSPMRCALSSTNAVGAT